MCPFCENNGLKVFEGKEMYCHCVYGLDLEEEENREEELADYVQSDDDDSTLANAPADCDCAFCHADRASGGGTPW